MKRSLRETFAQLPAEFSESLLPEIRDLLKAAGRTVFVLDDDPTGTQTVYDTPVLTTWTQEAITDEWGRGHQLIYILTNSRSLPEAEAQSLAAEIGSNLRAVAESLEKEFAVISRSDSTLRGHYPAEVDSLATAIGLKDSPQIIIPFFLQGGRFTFDDVHYVADGDDLIPASDTPFAKDAAFGFQNSNLIDWVVEKHQGRIRREQILSISLQDLRTTGPREIESQLSKLQPGSVCCVNAVSMRDMEVFATGLLRAQAAGARFVFRTAASFVQAYAGLDQKPLLPSKEMTNLAAKAGLIVVGSYVPKTTLQLDVLLDRSSNLQSVELDVDRVLDEAFDTYLSDVQQQIECLFESGHNVVLHTSRDLKTSADAEESLQIGNRVSAALVQIVRAIHRPLRFLIAKGGITSSDIATKALGIERAMVLGQILPGIPVWKTQTEGGQADLAFVVFPGNVGEDAALLTAYNKLK